MFLQNSDPAPPDPPNQSQIQAPTDLVSLVRASNPPGGLYVIYPAVMFMSSEKRRFQGLTWTSQMPFMVEEISQLQLSLSRRDDPAPPNSPKPKPNANPKQPGFIANLRNFGLHSTRTTLRTSSLYWVQESLGSRTEMQTLIKEAWDTRPEILHLQ
ncbi:PREDICTED: uncharacterized protein LOC105574773 isoform X2 [Cercocebus atys]|uniref:uncharacterized protein LOC105574773 isoform X2 n=1 Tax=Cercocebus atys TaxID=9531 RepID=UPI0005F3682D|nr:PREDICTED: uncharacterized protein LOC105574773 isoform X2 [Cercocebus atys]